MTPATTTISRPENAIAGTKRVKKIAPKIARFILTAVGRRRTTSQPTISGGTAAIAAQAAGTEAATKSAAKTSSTRRAGNRCSSCTARTVPKQ